MLLETAFHSLWFARDSNSMIMLFVMDFWDAQVMQTNKAGRLKKNFVKLAKHFVSYSQCSKQNPCLLLLDNHSPHLSAETLDYFKDNGVTLLSPPPLFTNKLKHLHRGVYEPLTKHINTVWDAWICTHKRPKKIYNIPSILTTAPIRVVTPVNNYGWVSSYRDFSTKPKHFYRHWLYAIILYW